MDSTRSCTLRTRLLSLSALVLALGLSLVWSVSAVADSPVLRMLRVVETSETLGVPDASGSAFPPHADSLLVLKGTSLGGTIQLMPRSDSPAHRLPSAKVSDAINITLDADGRVVLLDAKTRKLLVLSHAGGHQGTNLSSLKLKHPRGLTVDPATGDLYVLDGNRRIVVVEPGRGGSYHPASIRREGRASQIRLPGAWVALRGIAFDPETGHLHVYSPQTRELFELDRQGRAEAVRKLPADQGDPRAMAFAPSSDTTDPPERTSLFLVTRGSQRPQLTEWTLHPAAEAPAVVTRTPPLVPRQAFAAPAANGGATLVRNTHAWQYDPPSPDSAGIAYVPGSSSLLMSDSEVNEMNIYEGVNMFELSLPGSLFDTWDTTDYSTEPTPSSRTTPQRESGRSTPAPAASGTATTPSASSTPRTSARRIRKASPTTPPTASSTSWMGSTARCTSSTRGPTASSETRTTR
jgi:hypothetical protein